MDIKDINIDKIDDLIRKSIEYSLTTEEQQLLAHWIEQDSDNMNTYQRLKAIYALKQVGASSPFNAMKKKELIAKVTKSHRRLFTLLRSAVAIILVCGGVGGYLWFADTNTNDMIAIGINNSDNSGIRILRNNESIDLSGHRGSDNLSYSLNKEKRELSLQQIKATSTGKPNKIRIVVDKGHQYKITLPDSSTVWLNASSEIAYDSFSDTLRCVELKGEACFDVTKDPKRPFLVKLASGNNITVLGTLFNVRAYVDEPLTKIALLKGIVHVDTKAEKITLKPNKEVSINQGGKITLSDVRNENCIAWIHGGFVFDNEYFEDIARDLSRRYNCSFIIMNRSIARERLTINIPHSSLIDVISYLKMAGRGLFYIEYKDGQIIIN